jgi:Ca2+-binding RTX toxin-like protein
MANMTPREQLMLELINRARMDPAAEAARFGISLNEGVSSGNTISASPKQVLAGNDSLAFAADKHSNWMIQNDVFSHNETTGSTGFYGTTPFNRMNTAGYDFTTAGENIAFRGTTASAGSAQQTQWILDQHRDLFVDAGYPGRGHRVNILSTAFEEVGVGQGLGTFRSQGVNYNASLITQDFGTRTASHEFITGVVYNDTTVNDNFFSVGEQTVGRAVSTAGAATDTTGAGGGYELELASGAVKTVSFALATGTVRVAVSITTASVKVDIVNGDEVWSSTNLTALGTNIDELHGLGFKPIRLSGGTASELIFGNKGSNNLQGNGGNDTIQGNKGRDLQTGGSGADTFVYKLASDSTSSIRDTIVDFQDSGADRIDLRSVATGTLEYRGTAIFNDDGQVRVTTSGSNVLVSVNLDSDSTAEMQILLRNTTTTQMSSGDFLL